MIRVLLADDHQMFIDGIRQILDAAEGFEVAAEANNGHEVIHWMGQKEVDVVLLDIDMPEVDGENTLAVLRKRNPETKILVVTMHDEPSYIKKFMQLDVDGYVLKNTNKDELLWAIRRVYEGHQYFGSDLLNKVRAWDWESNLEENEEDPLSDREKEIVRLTANEHSIPEIADKLYISVNTVKTHRRNIQQKIDAKSLGGIIRYAFEHGLADPIK